MTVDEYIRVFRKRLEVLYPPEEARAVALRAVSAVMSWEPQKIYSSGDTSLSEEQCCKLDRISCDLEKGRPAQYVLGSTEFAGLRIKVKEGCLIPRPETEQLFNLAADDAEAMMENAGDELETFNVLDICTGSGCLAYAFAAEFTGIQVYGCDISDEALSIACSQKIKQCAAKPVFFSADVLKEPPTGLPEFDMIVSNPPYIMEGEKALMQKNVLEYEPHIALFVPDDDPLKFYRAIARWADVLLKKNGHIWLEVNESLAEETAALFKNAEVLKDFNDKARFVYVC